MKEYYPIGRVTKTHGLKGEMKVHLDDNFSVHTNQLDVVFLEENGFFLPFFVDQWRGNGPYIVKLEGIDSIDVASRFTNKPVFIFHRDFNKLSKSGSDGALANFETLVGYQLINEADQSTWTIEEVMEYPMQKMLLLANPDATCMVPWVKDWVLQLDQVKKVLVVRLPDGLY